MLKFLFLKTVAQGWFMKFSSAGGGVLREKLNYFLSKPRAAGGGGSWKLCSQDLDFF